MEKGLSKKVKDRIEAVEGMDVREAAEKRYSIAASLATRRTHPERMSALKNPLSEAETALRSHLLAIELPFEERYLCGIYVVGFFIPELGIVIDCQGRNRFPLSFERNEAILAKNRGVVYCVNDFVKKGNFAYLDEYIAGVKASRFNPTSMSKETVILGACGSRPFGNDTDKFIVHRFGVRSNYCTILTTDTDN